MRRAEELERHLQDAIERAGALKERKTIAEHSNLESA
jgi:hypothetical protein